MSRLIVGLIINGANLLLKGFIGAYQKVVASGGRTIKQQAEQTTQTSKAFSLGSLFERKMMDLDEAHMVLGTSQGETPQQIEERFNHLFTSNDPDKGGSFYIQSKIYRAKEAIDYELKKAQEQPENKQGP
eukprot:TRINITY_DN16049_c0_g1_i1.p1 TRINITY_DN16049_c0_g1~~TRINITY_DN16049_c0_g1_i1.p1  ORF type:complete len:130 (-),score=25.67 TRINITY_DN16049_c0_g1_i1:120-509(-)